MALVQASIRRAATLVGRVIVDTVYPKTCAGCGMRGYWLCEYCEEETLPLDVPGMCLRCGEVKHPSGCGCGDLRPSISGARAVAVYDGWTAQAIRRVKYEGEPDRARHLASLMAPVLRAFGPIDGLVPVPLHHSKQKSRGFNQAALLAEGLSRTTGVPVIHALTRTKNTVSQTTLSGRERHENVAGVFAMDPGWAPAPGRRYVLIDDVRTTGATLGACAGVLASTSPAMIGVLTFALDMQPDELRAHRDYVRQIRSGATPTP